MIDSHCHLNCLSLDDLTLNQVIQRAYEVGVEYILCPGIEPTQFESILEIARQYPTVKAGLGIHPNDVNQFSMSEDELYDWIDRPEVIAVGETGLDYYRDSASQSLQQSQFRQHIRVSKALNKPLIIHARDAHQDVLKILEEEDSGPAVMHCFTDTLETAEAAIDLGCLISFSGIITFKNASDLRAVVQALPLNRLLIETDAPYLAPVPFRGQSNFPEYVIYVAQKVAELKEVSLETVIEATSSNFKQLFGWPYSDSGVATSIE